MASISAPISAIVGCVTLWYYAVTLRRYVIRTSRVPLVGAPLIQLSRSSPITVKLPWCDLAHIHYVGWSLHLVAWWPKLEALN